MTTAELLEEYFEASRRFWFVQTAQIVEQTDNSLTLHFQITPQLLVQAFLSTRSDRLSLALIGPAGRLYGRDGRKGQWHRHPFDDPSKHESTPEGVSPQPLLQFLSEVEDILQANDLL
jgi:predicted DNA-binding WGR domain protein